MYTQSVPALVSKNIGNTLANYKTWNSILINPKEYGAKGDGATDDIAAFNRVISYIESHTVGTQMKFNGKSASEVTVDLGGSVYAISDCLVISKSIVLAHVNFRNGTICPTSNFSSTDSIATNHLIRVGKGVTYGQTANIKFHDVVFDGKESVKGVYLYQCMNTVFSRCTFTNIDIGIEWNSSDTHETVVTDCYFINNYGTYYGTCAMKITNDSQITDNQIIGFTDGILLTGGGNLIKGNHIWGLPTLGRGIKGTGSTNMNNVVSENYFDGCPIEFEKANNLVVTNNIFLSPRTYASIYLKYLSGSALQNCVITGNTVYVDLTRTPKRDHTSGAVTISGNLMTTTTANFTPQMVGASLSLTANDIICEVSGYLDANNLYIKKGKSVADGDPSYAYIASQVISIWQYNSEWTSISPSFIAHSNVIYQGNSKFYGNGNGVYSKFGQPYPQLLTPVDIINTTHTSNSTADQTVTFNIMPRGFIVLANIDGGSAFSIGVGRVSPQTLSLTNISRSLFLDTTYTQDTDDFIRIKTPTGIVQGRIKSIADNVLTIQWATTATAAETINLTFMAL